MATNTGRIACATLLQRAWRTFRKKRSAGRAEDGFRAPQASCFAKLRHAAGFSWGTLFAIHHALALLALFSCIKLGNRAVVPHHAGPDLAAGTFVFRKFNGCFVHNFDFWSISVQAA